MPIKNLIITGANTAREINPMGDTMPNHDAVNYYEARKLWQEAESSLKEYRITNKCTTTGLPEDTIRYLTMIGHRKHFKTKFIGDKATFECNDDNLTCEMIWTQN